VGIKKAKSSKSKAGKVIGKVKKAIGMKGGSGGRKAKGVTYWSNKVLVEKLKKKFNKIKYGSVR